MKKDNKYPVIILARKESKALPGKNIRTFAGKPLLAWSILQALGSKRVSKVSVSSDCKEILQVAKSYGAETILRPAGLSRDRATSESGWNHAIQQLTQISKKPPTVVVALQATSPLRESSDIDDAIERFEKDKADSLFSNAALHGLCVWSDEGGALKRRTYDSLPKGRGQNQRPFLLENGSIYIFKTGLLQRARNRLSEKISCFTMPSWKSFKIDDVVTFEICETLFLKKLIKRENKSLKYIPELIVYDFDGVMTDNRAILMEDGNEGVWVNRSDGWGVQQLKKAGYLQVILSTEKNPVVTARAKKLQIEVIQGSSDKAKCLKNYCQKKHIKLNKVLFVGNDINDLGAMKIVGFSVAPANAHPEVLQIASFVTRAKGGDGVLREISESVLKNKIKLKP
jgi:N-acylneuraminate cytidylyltransferase